MVVLSQFVEPFYTGTAAISAEIPAAWDVALDGVGYMVDWKRYGRRILPADLEQRDRSEREPGELSLSQEGFRLRSRSNWDLGAGQLYVDRADSLEGMFWRSQGIDVFTENQTCLLNDTELAEADTATAMWCFTVGNYFYLVDDTTVRYTTDPHAGTISWTTVTGITGTITGVTTDGNRVFLAKSGSTLMDHTVGAAAAANFGALTPDGVQFANGRLIGWDGAEIYEIDNAGAKVVIWTHPRTGVEWSHVVSTPLGIFAALDLAVSSVDSGRVQFFHMTTNDATGGLSAPTWAGELPTGEKIHALERYNRVIIIGTSEGVRFAEYGKNNLSVGTLDVGRSSPVRGSSGDVVDGAKIPVRCFEGVGEHIWFGWSTFNATQSGLGRMDLSRTVFADEIVPPMASDLMADAGVSADVLDIATFANKRLFCVSGSGLWRETGDKVASGWLEEGLISFGLTHAKAFSNIRYGTAADGQTTSLGTVTLELTTEDGSTLSVGPYETSLKALGSIDVDLVGRDFMLKTTLARAAGDVTLGPCFRHWSAEAFPQTSISYEIILPIKATSKVADRHGNQMVQRPGEMLERLDQLARGGKSVITYQEFRRTERCRIRSVEIIPGDFVSAPAARNNSREYMNTLITVRLFTRPTTTV